VGAVCGGKCRGTAPGSRSSSTLDAPPSYTPGVPPSSTLSGAS
jgi:hypothetical protein